MSNDRDSDWFDEFWSELDEDVDEDGGISAIRLLAELYDAGLIDRDGDYLTGNNLDESDRVHLTIDDQYLVRRIFDAVDITNRPKP